MNLGFLPACLCISLCLATSAFAQGSDPVGGWNQPIWNFSPGMVDYVSPEIVPDCTGDGIQDVLLQNWEHNGQIVLLDGKTGVVWMQSGEDLPNGGSVTIADLDGDQVSDVLFREPRFSLPLAPNLGRIRLSQGGSKNLLWGQTGRQNWQRLGSHVRITDLDGDTKPDVLSFAPNRAMVALSGATGARLWENHSLNYEWLRLCPDTNGDGVSELALSSGTSVIFLDGASGAILWQRRGAFGGNQKYSDMTFVDLTGDGVHEIILTDYHATGESNQQRAGGIQVFDGHSGMTLWSFRGPYERAQVGEDLSFTDANADGTLDILNVSWKYQCMLDGKTGDVIWLRDSFLAHGGTPPEKIDLNQDGVLDLLAIGGKSPLDLVAIDGRTGKSLWVANSTDGSATWRRFEVADINGDSILDVVASCPWAHDSQGEVVAIDGMSGAILWTKKNPGRGNSFGYRLFVNKRRPPFSSDVLVRSLGFEAEDGIFSLSGKRGTLQWFLPQPSFTKWDLEWHPADLNDDGRKELIEVNTSSKPYLLSLDPRNGNVINRQDLISTSHSYHGVINDIDGDHIQEHLLSWSGFNGFELKTFSGEKANYTTGIKLSSNTLSASQGGSISVYVDFPSHLATWPYRLLLSSSGTQPTTLRNIEVPLASDALFERCLANRFPPTAFIHPTGQLDTLGDAIVEFSALPKQIDIHAVGKVIHVAVIVEYSVGVPKFSSGAEAFSIVM